MSLADRCFAHQNVLPRTPMAGLTLANVAWSERLDATRKGLYLMSHQPKFKTLSRKGGMPNTSLQNVVIGTHEVG